MGFFNRLLLTVLLCGGCAYSSTIRLPRDTGGYEPPKRPGSGDSFDFPVITLGGQRQPSLGGLPVLVVGGGQTSQSSFATTTGQRIRPGAGASVSQQSQIGGTFGLRTTSGAVAPARPLTGTLTGRLSTTGVASSGAPRPGTTGIPQVRPFPVGNLAIPSPSLPQQPSQGAITSTVTAQRRPSGSPASSADAVATRFVNIHFSPAEEVSNAEFTLRNSENIQTTRDGELVDPNATYELRYHVRDPLSGDNKEVAQSGSATSQSGFYIVTDTDGTVRRTDWTADGEGYRAVVSITGTDGGVFVQEWPGQPPEPVSAIRQGQDQIRASGAGQNIRGGSTSTFRQSTIDVSQQSRRPQLISTRVDSQAGSFRGIQIPSSATVDSDGSADAGDSSEQLRPATGSVGTPIRSGVRQPVQPSSVSGTSSVQRASQVPTTRALTNVSGSLRTTGQTGSKGVTLHSFGGIPSIATFGLPMPSSFDFADSAQRQSPRPSSGYSAPLA